ncbi:MAG: hypothetical protein H0X14_12375, partial [Acidobacteria bacterium]|nr:hypothetical protein [Acidobacteriota bacterium]
MKSRRSTTIICIFLILAGLFPACSRDPQSEATGGRAEDSPPRQMFGVQLRPQARALVTEIEKHYGKRVREETRDNLDYSYYAALSSIDADGTPSIRMDADVPPTEATIVHELWHIKLYSKGF